MDLNTDISLTTEQGQMAEVQKAIAEHNAADPNRPPDSTQTPAPATEDSTPLNGGGTGQVPTEATTAPQPSDAQPAPPGGAPVKDTGIKNPWEQTESPEAQLARLTAEAAELREQVAVLQAGAQTTSAPAATQTQQQTQTPAANADGIYWGQPGHESETYEAYEVRAGIKNPDGTPKAPAAPKPPAAQTQQPAQQQTQTQGYKPSDTEQQAANRVLTELRAVGMNPAEVAPKLSYSITTALMNTPQVHRVAVAQELLRDEARLTAIVKRDPVSQMAEVQNIAWGVITNQKAGAEKRAENARNKTEVIPEIPNARQNENPENAKLPINLNQDDTGIARDLVRSNTVDFGAGPILNP